MNVYPGQRRRAHLSIDHILGVRWPTALLYYGYCVATVIDSAGQCSLAGNRQRVLRPVDRKSDLHRCFGAVSILPRQLPAATFAVRRHGHCSCHAQLFGPESVCWPPTRCCPHEPVRAAVPEKPIVPFQRSTSLNTLFQQYPAVAPLAYNWQSTAAKCNRIVVIVVGR